MLSGLKLSRVWLLAFCLSFTALTTPSFASQSKCAELLHLPVEFEIYGEDFVLVNGIPVTGQFMHPLKVVMGNLGITELDVQKTYRNKKVLTIGEGVSELLPFFLAQGVAARGLDVWYHNDGFDDNYSGKIMRKYVRKYGAHLIQGDAKKIPLRSGSIDKVFSHLLVNNVEHDEQVAIVEEVIRILKVGGEARLFGFGDDGAELIQDYISAEAGEKVRFTTKRITFEIDFRGHKREKTLSLLIIKKLRARDRRKS